MRAGPLRFVGDVPVVLRADPNAPGRPVTRAGDIMTSVPITALMPPCPSTRLRG